ncbi:hypothetical protein AMAG_18167 [Allomyces macrogynus ATCC 38327]|uniref:Uncharacterized protein n=1 Tax=Allomyces macrogynus (strain ATCC 38327) TaxID=578462 RepID=A0A0L0SAF7_ALLM3|nr:hypothetical protein AMAG_18167 [Allomyces macrogynus ATCC 38327]|eukprot:KNE59385.1 hypothetical protein AMAG_18167 [Allomyces macrogynus ATCC 38327]
MVTAPPEMDDEEGVTSSTIPATPSAQDVPKPAPMATVAQLLAEARAQSLLAPADLDRFDAMADKNGLRGLPVDHATWLAMVAAMQHAPSDTHAATAPTTAVTSTAPADASAPPLPLNQSRLGVDDDDDGDDLTAPNPDTASNTPSLPTSPSSGGTWLTPPT